MLASLSFFKNKGMDRFRGENILQTGEYVLGVCKTLDFVKALTHKHVNNIPGEVALCNNNRFRNTFKLLSESADLENVKILLIIKDEDVFHIDIIGTVLNKAIHIFDKIC